jgi:hypothetical protein
MDCSVKLHIVISGSVKSADRWLKRGHTGRHETFLDVFVPGKKPSVILRSEKPIRRTLREVTSVWPQTILFGQVAFIIIYLESALAWGYPSAA